MNAVQVLDGNDGSPRQVSTFQVARGREGVVLAILKNKVAVLESQHQQSVAQPTTSSRSGGGGGTTTGTDKSNLAPRVVHLANAGAQSRIRIVAVSDTHSLHHQVPLSSVPDGDVFVHCGDFSKKGSTQEVNSFAEWLASVRPWCMVGALSSRDIAPCVLSNESRLRIAISSLTFSLWC